MDYSLAVLEALRKAVEEDAVKGNTAVMFSGGLDSSIIAHLLTFHSDPFLYTVGVEGCYDLKTAEESASILDLPWTGIVVNDDDILTALRELIKILGTTNPVVLSFEMPLQLISSRVKESHIYSGQGADELFGGYAKYLAVDINDRKKMMKADLVKLFEEGLDRERKIANRLGKTIHYPYLHWKVVEAVGKIPVEEEFSVMMGKVVLRKVARELDLGIIAERKKKAAQYGSGIMKTLKKAARSNGMSLSEFINHLKEKSERH